MAEKNGPDITIVGGGVAGLNTGIEAQKSGYSVKILDALPYDLSLTRHPGKNRATRRTSESGAQFFPMPGENTSKEQEEKIAVWIEDAVSTYIERELVDRYRR